MLIHLDFVVVLQLFCLVQGLTTAAYLLLARPGRAGGRWLGWLLLGLTLQVVDYSLSRSGVYFRHRWLYFTPLFFPWGFGLLLWAYVRCQYRDGNGLRLRWPHFLPVVAQCLFYVVLAAQSFDTKTWFWLSVHKPVTRYIEHYGAVLLMAGYLGLSLRCLARHERRPRWLWYALLGLGGLYLTAAIDPLVNAAYLPVGAPKFYLATLGLPVYTYGLALLAWLTGASQRVFRPESFGVLESHRANRPLPAAPRLSSPPINAAQLAQVVQALEQDELFKDPDLTLDTLAQHVGLSPNTVSQLVNAGLNQSFSDLINGYRLAEVKRRLLTADVRRLTVLALALEAGFNSKTTFNRVFKEKTGLTPKEYQKKYHSTHRDDS